MYKEFFSLERDPFGLTPNPAFLYMTAEHREALAGLVYTVHTRPGLALLTGEVGTGKTTLLNALLAFLESRNWRTAVCDNPTLTRAEFYDFILAKFGIQCPSSLKSQQLMALREALLKARAEGQFFLLVVDEAQRLPLKLLEEVRLLMNLETPREKLLQIIMAGQPELLNTIRLTELRQLKQRISCYCRLQPLGEEDVKEYINYRLERAGLPQQTLFPDATAEAIYRYSGGIPRIINTICDSALRIGFALQSKTISTSIIDEVATDLDLRAISSVASPPRIEPKAVSEPKPMKVVAPPTFEACQPPSPPVPVDRAVSTTSFQSTPPENGAVRPGSLRFLADLARRWK